MFKRPPQRPVQPAPRRLKKQPKMQRVNAAYVATVPQLALPQDAVQAARRRKRSQSKLKFRWPTELLRQLVTSPRWISLGVLGLAVYALVLIGSNADFYLTTIPVEGVYSIAPEEIVAMSGLAGQHVFAADPAAAAEAIAHIPGIIAAEVEITWPNQVRIHVQEDSPIAVWQQGEELFWVNSTGTLMPARIDVPGLVRIESLTPNAIIGRTYAEPEIDAQTGEALETAVPELLHEGSIPTDILTGALLLHQLFPDQTTIRYDSAHGLIVADPRGWDVYVGTGDDMAQKLAVYEALLSDLTARDLTPLYVSVSNQQKPYYKAIEENE